MFRPVKIHKLKTHPEYFKNIKMGRKTAEVRIDDRDFCIGDPMIIKEYLPKKKKLTGRKVGVVITDIVRLKRMFDIEPNLVLLSFMKMDPETQSTIMAVADE